VNALRRAGRIVAAALAAWFLIVVATQYVRAVQRNADLAHQLAAAQSDIVTLTQKRDRQLRDISRLSDPRGAVPEIHDRLKFAGPHEAIVYLKKSSPAPAASSVP
jgi:hypothetical protein